MAALDPADALYTMILAECRRADVLLEAFSADDDRMEFTISCELGTRTLGVTGLRGMEIEVIEKHIHDSVVDWTAD